MFEQQSHDSKKSPKALFSSIQMAYQKNDSEKLTQLLRQLYTSSAYSNYSNSGHINQKKNAEKWKFNINFNVFEDSAFGSLFGKMLDSIRLYQIQRVKKGINFAFKFHLEVISKAINVLEEIKDQDLVHFCKPLRQIIRSTKKIFMSASKIDQQTGSPASVKKDDVIIKLQQFKTKRTLKQEVKKQIMPLIDNMQVSIMLVYHTYDQISRILDNSKSYGEHGIQFQDNYFFQKAKTALIYQNFKIAEQFFQKINIRTKGQKRLVLKYLIPCKMFLGKSFAPNQANPEESFPQYEPILKALGSAKFLDYSEAIKKYQKVWIKRGIYLLMDKLRIILWRNLLKKVNKILGGDKIEISKILQAVKLSGGDEQLDECVCIISNLIYEGYIKGYIFQNETQKVLVLKKGGQGFPLLSKLR